MTESINIQERLYQPISFGDLVAINFVAISETDSTRILGYRNHPDIRCWMNHSQPISISEHSKFVEKLRHDEHNQYWVVRNLGSADDLGVIYLNNICDREAEFGVYANPFLARRGIGGQLAKIELHIAFDLLDLETVRLSVFHQNEKALRLYHRLGFVVTEKTTDKTWMKLSRVKYLTSVRVA